MIPDEHDTPIYEQDDYGTYARYQEPELAPGRRSQAQLYAAALGVAGMLVMLATVPDGIVSAALFLGFAVMAIWGSGVAARLLGR